MRFLDCVVSILPLIAAFPAIAARLADMQKELSSYREARARDEAT